MTPLVTPLAPSALGALVAALTLSLAPLSEPSSRSPVPAGSPGAPASLGSPVSTGALEATARRSDASWPVSPAHVIAPFEDPLPYAPGHRGVDLAATTGQTVMAALPGRVTVAGHVAGRPLIVVAHADDIRTTYLPVQPYVSVGDLVKAGDLIGTVVDQGPVEHCVVTCLHWGARRGENYIDPQSLVNPSWLSGPIVLLPEP